VMRGSFGGALLALVLVGAEAPMSAQGAEADAVATAASSAATAQTKTKRSTRKKTARSKKTAASKKKAVKTATKKRSAKKSGPTTVPVDFGIGPAFHWISGPIQDDRAPHYGIKLSLAAIIDKQTLQENKGRIPKKYRGMVSKLGEVRYTPTIFIPDTIFISPPTRDESTAMYGASWRPFGLGFPLIKSPRLRIGADIDLTYAYIDGEESGLGVTHFLRPGIAIGADLEIPLSKSFLISFGWSSGVYIPQEVGGPIFAIGDLEDSIWHIGQAFVQLHFRFPYTVAL